MIFLSIKMRVAKWWHFETGQVLFWGEIWPLQQKEKTIKKPQFFLLFSKQILYPQLINLLQTGFLFNITINDFGVNNMLFHLKKSGEEWLILNPVLALFSLLFFLQVRLFETQPTFTLEHQGAKSELETVASVDSRAYSLDLGFTWLSKMSKSEKIDIDIKWERMMSRVRMMRGDRGVAGWEWWAIWEGWAGWEGWEWWEVIEVLQVRLAAKHHLYWDQTTASQQCWLLWAYLLCALFSVEVG